ncbi:MAG: Rrf2 family transcriptional regulator [Lachnospiraceae bacterium]|nr:Rrf2 family transcriptional regulator [Lachnospiraceae bacterium]
MKYSTKLSDTVHLMAFIHINPKQDLSSSTIAYSIHTNPSYVRQLMMALRKSGLLNSSQGQAKPSLAKSPEDISLLDIYRAVEGQKPLLHLDTNINPDCNVGVNIHYTLRDYYQQVQNAAEGEMRKITLEDIIRGFYERSKNQPLYWD